MTEPNSLFSNMMMAICSKFGTSGWGVAVGEGTVVGVCVGVAVEGGYGVTVGAGSGTVGNDAGVLSQAARISRMSRVKKDFIFMVVL